MHIAGEKLDFGLLNRPLIRDEKRTHFCTPTEYFFEYDSNCKKQGYIDIFTIPSYLASFLAKKSLKSQMRAKWKAVYSRAQDFDLSYLCVMRDTQVIYLNQQ